jgi:hypothetical protein
MKGNKVSKCIRRSSYGLYFKTMVIKHAEQTNNWETARKYSIFWDKCLNVERTGTGTCQFYAKIIIYIVECLLKARVVKPAETAVARERFCKHAHC